jgi:hypothetical protein
MTMSDFDARLDEEQRELLSKLDTPIEIQAFLDSIPYSAEDANRCPLSVLRDRQAHCLDGALFAAAALRRLGHAPVLVDLLPEPGTDDDHVLAIIKQDGCFGALAKSNFTGLRYRETVYDTMRELVMSYFEFFSTWMARRPCAPILSRCACAPSIIQLDVGDEGADAVSTLLHLRKIPVERKDGRLSLAGRSADLQGRHVRGKRSRAV